MCPVHRDHQQAFVSNKYAEQPVRHDALDMYSCVSFRYSEKQFRFEATTYQSGHTKRNNHSHFSFNPRITLHPNLIAFRRAISFTIQAFKSHQPVHVCVAFSIQRAARPSWRACPFPVPRWNRLRFSFHQPTTHSFHSASSNRKSFTPHQHSFPHRAHQLSFFSSISHQSFLRRCRASLHRRAIFSFFPTLTHGRHQPPCSCHESLPNRTAPWRGDQRTGSVHTVDSRSFPRFMRRDQSVKSLPMYLKIATYSEIDNAESTFPFPLSKRNANALHGSNLSFVPVSKFARCLLNSDIPPCPEST